MTNLLVQFLRSRSVAWQCEGQNVSEANAYTLSYGYYSDLYNNMYFACCNRSGASIQISYTLLCLVKDDSMGLDVNMP